MKRMRKRFTGVDARVIVMVVLGCLAGEVSAESEGLLDPTRPPPEVMQMPGQSDLDADPVLTLSAVKESGKNSFAIINNTVVHLGEVFQEHKLIGIFQTHVVLQDAAKNKITLSLNLVDYRRPVVNADNGRLVQKRKQAVSSHH